MPLVLYASTIKVLWQYVVRPHDRTHRKLPKNEMARVTVAHPWMLPDLERRIAVVAAHNTLLTRYYGSVDGVLERAREAARNLDNNQD